VKTGIPIFEYHDLSEKADNIRTFHSPYILLTSKFYEQMSWLSKNGYQTLSIDDLIHNRISNKSVVLSFDDGHISNYTLAFPILKHFKFIATFFIVPKYFNKNNYLTREQILEMHQQGMRFESHSLTHPYIVSLSRKEIVQELTESKDIIQGLLNTAVNHFSIPYGFYNKDLVRHLEEAGYKSLVTEDFGYYKFDKSSFQIVPRFIVKSEIELGKFKNIAERRKSRLITEYSTAKCIQNLKAFLGYRMYIRLKSLILNTSP
jgi:peptidoglycan/xylan/chitin deacetylase (PgdA/CDA1 family)